MDEIDTRQHRAAIQKVGRALLERNREIAQEMVTRIVEEVPAYRRVQAGVIDDVVLLSTATAEILGQALAAATPVQREDVPVVSEHAARRVRQGVPLDAFLHAYRAALFGYWDACAQEASQLRVTRHASLALARFALDAIDTITTHAAEAYLREETRLRTQSGREARDLLERLIHGQVLAAGRRHPAAPGLDPTAQLVTVVGRVERAPGRIAAGDALQLARDTLERGAALGKATPLLTIRQGEIVIIAALRSPAETLDALLSVRQLTLQEHHLDVRYGLSAPAPGFAGVQRAYQEAVLALSYTTSQHPVVSLGELSSLECALVGADQATRSVIASKAARLAALSPQDLSVIEETVRAFAGADLSVARAAQHMHVHPNTVRYRLAHIATATGHDPRTFHGLVELTCALETIRSYPAEPGLQSDGG
ncbi:MAG TPA: helix-turn-helix domain-containing protein [Solirubrobacteraceae bacterium]